MAAGFSLPTPGVRPFALPSGLTAAGGGAAATPSEAIKVKAKAAAQNFEAMFLNSMFEQMYTGLDGDGPFGGKGATGVWRSFLTDAYAKSVTKAGGIGIASQVYKTLMAEQEAQR